MKKKYLTVFAITLVFTASIILFTQSTYALDSVPKPDAGTPSTNTTETDPPAEDSTLNLTLEDAFKLLETGNKALKLTDDKILILEKQNKQALARHNANIPVVDEDTRKDRDLNYKRTQWTLDNAKHDREIQLKDLKAQITNEYQNILTLQQQAKNLKTQQGNLEKIIDQVNLQIELGLIVPTDIHTYNAQKSKLEAAQNAIANSIKSSMLTLKQDLGIEINRNVVLTSSPIQYTKFDDSDVDNKIAKAVENSYELSKYEQDIELTQIEYDIAFYYDNMMADQIQLSIEDNKATLASLTTTLEVRF
ncbi:MAG: TolC family protein, partial [Desulfosporosinus sp.]